MRAPFGDESRGRVMTFGRTVPTEVVPATCHRGNGTVTSFVDGFVGNYILEASRATALTEIDSDFRKSGRVIIPLTVREVWDEEISGKLA